MDLKVAIKRLRDIEKLTKTDRNSNASRYQDSRRNSINSNSSGANESGEKPQDISYWNAAESLFSPSAPLLISRQNSYVFYVYRQNKPQNPFSKESNEPVEVEQPTEAPLEEGTEEVAPTLNSRSRITTANEEHRPMLHHWKTSASLHTLHGQSVRKNRRQSLIVTNKSFEPESDAPEAFHNAKNYWLAEVNKIEKGCKYGFRQPGLNSQEADMKMLALLSGKSNTNEQDFLSQLTSFKPDLQTQTFASEAGSGRSADMRVDIDFEDEEARQTSHSSSRVSGASSIPTRTPSCPFPRRK